MKNPLAADTAATARFWLAAMSAVGLGGTLASIALASDSQWATTRSLSWLGIDPGSALVFNLSLLLIGASLVGLAAAITCLFEQLRQYGQISRLGAAIMGEGLYLAGLAIMISAVFQVGADPAHLIHNIAGFTAPAAIMAIISGARLVMSSLGRRFDTASALALIMIIVLFVAADWLRIVPYAAMEMAAFVLIGAWLWLFEARLRSLIEQLASNGGQLDQMAGEVSISIDEFTGRKLEAS